jgi:lamin tail-like protein/putative Ig domain-containing protein
VNSVRADLEPFPPLWLNEVAPINASGITNKLGARGPWVELYNAGNSAIDLTGFYLSDNYTNLAQWAFPTNTLIGARQFLIVWADGKAAIAPVGELHTDFRIHSATGSVALAWTSLSGVRILDYLNYTEAGTDRSYGAVPDGQPFSRQVLHYPTPGATNNASSLAISVVINEWMASNTRTLLDPAPPQSFDDWFELYNPTTRAIDLSGYFLTDTLTNKTKWKIPFGTIMSPSGYLLVWADEETFQNGFNGDLHANFKLSSGGEAIGLFAPDGTTIDTVTFGAQTNDVSQGRFPDGGLNQMPYFVQPTPGSPNTLESNLPPVLAPISDRIIHEGSQLSFVVRATDPNLVPQILTFSLDPGGPPGAAVHPTDGVFTWTPGPGTAPSKNPVTVRVTDNGRPQLSDTKTFTIEVVPPLRFFDVRVTPEGIVTLNAPAIVGRTYRIEYADSLESGEWQTLGQNILATDSTIMITDNLVATGQRFYRVRLLD